MDFFYLLDLCLNGPELFFHWFVYGLWNLSHFLCDFYGKILNDTIDGHAWPHCIWYFFIFKTTLEVLDEGRMRKELIYEVVVDNVIEGRHSIGNIFYLWISFFGKLSVNYHWQPVEKVEIFTEWQKCNYLKKIRLVLYFRQDCQFLSIMHNFYTE